MVKLIGTVIDSNLRLAGLVFKGHPRYFNELSEEKEIQKAVPMGASAGLLKHCKNFTLQGKALVARNERDSLNELQMFTIKGTPLNNQIRLVKRIVVDDKVEGYLVEFGFGDKKKFRTCDIIKLAGYFKPDNFIVKHRASGVFLTGKPGVSLSDLPAERSQTPGYKGKTRVITGGVIKDIGDAENIESSNIDIISLMDVLEKADAFVIAMSPYNKTMHQKMKTDSNFTKLSSGLDAIGNAKLVHSESKIKANVLFKKAGYVAIDGMPPVLAYTFSSRTLLMNDTNNMDKIGVAIPAENYANVINYLKGCKGLIKAVEITNQELIKSAKALTGNKDKDLKFIQIDLNGVKIMSNESVKNSLMGIKDIAADTYTIETNKVILKAIRPVIESLTKYDKTQTEVHSMFKMYNEEMLSILTENKIDIKTGAYKGVIKTETKDENGNDIPVKEDESYEIVYSILPSTVTGKKADLLMKEGTAGKIADIDSKLDKIRESLAKASEEEAYGYLMKIRNRLEEQNEELIKKLWLHKVAMIKQGKELHKEDSSLWVEKPNKSKVKVNTYTAKVGNVALNVKMSGDLFINASQDAKPVKQKVASKKAK